MRKLIVVLVAMLAVFGTGATLVSFAPLPGSVLASDDDCDSSGSGNGNCDDDDRGDDHTDDNHSGSGHGGDDLDEDDIAAQTALAQPVGAREIRFADERVVPNTITVRVGETVTFVNADDDEHTATGLGFDTGVMLPGDSVAITFDQPGSFDFVCQFHPDMRGTVIVQGSGTPVAASPIASPVAQPADSPDAASAVVTIDIVDFAFSQPELTIAPGTTVTWTNTGVAPHTVSGLPTESGTLEPGASFSFTFTDAGAFDYRCAFHPQMVGRITVDPDAPPSGA